MASALNGEASVSRSGDADSDTQVLLEATVAPAAALLRGQRRIKYFVTFVALAALGLSVGASLGSLRSLRRGGRNPMTIKVDTIVQQYETWDNEHTVKLFLAGLKHVPGGKEEKRKWLENEMKHVKTITTLRALHTYYSIAGAEDLFGGPYEDQVEGQAARMVIEWGLHKYDGDDWRHYMNEEIATKKPPAGDQAGVGSSASLIAQVYPPNEKFVILVLAWLPVDKYPWAGKGGIGAAHTHGQATCNFKFLNAVEGAGNTFYDIAGGDSTVTDMFKDGKPHKGGCKDHDYVPILLKPDTGRQFIHSKDLMGNTSAFIQDDYGAHSIDNLNTTHIAFSVHVYYPPYAHGWAFHEHSGVHGQQCKKRLEEGSEGMMNCKHPHHRMCGTTTMKDYLEKAAEYKERDEQNSIQWYHNLCHKKFDRGSWLFRQCVARAGSAMNEYMENLVTSDPTLDE